MKFRNRLAVDFLGKRDGRGGIKDRWELTESLYFDFEGTHEFGAALKKFNIHDAVKVVLKDTFKAYITVKVQKKFITDLASIHRVCWALISPWDVARGAVVHDMFYRKLRILKEEGMSKKEIEEYRLVADQLFLMGMQAAEPAIPNWKVKCCYNFVRVFGRFVI